jgi:DNA-binding NarL/FixJ family response regulator
MMVLEVPRDPVHAGYIVLKGERIVGRHHDHRYWDLGVTQEVDRVITQRGRARRRGLRPRDFLLAGLIMCGHCGRPMTAYHASATGKRSYRCDGRVVPSYESHRSVGKLAEAVEIAVVEEVRKTLSDGIIQTLTSTEVAALAVAELQNLRDEEDRVRQQLASAAADLTDAISLHRSKGLSDAAFQNAKGHLESRIEDLTCRSEQAKTRRQHLVGNEVRLGRARQAASDFSTLWDHLDTEERRGLLQTLVEEITATREGRNIRLRFKFHFLPPAERLIPPLVGACGADALERLSISELSFLELWSRGLRDAEISEVSEWGPSTARQYVHSIRRKLGIDSMEDAARMARDQIELNRPFLHLSKRAKQRSRRSPLSTTETEVLTLWAERRSYAGIALRLGKATGGIHNAACRARQKLKVRTNEEAVAKAREMGALGSSAEVRSSDQCSPQVL